MPKSIDEQLKNVQNRIADLQQKEKALKARKKRMLEKSAKVQIGKMVDNGTSAKAIQQHFVGTDI